LAVELEVALLVCDVTVRLARDDLQVVEHLKRNLFFVLLAGIVAAVERPDPA
jgi:hypothetical protein